MRNRLALICCLMVCGCSGLVTFPDSPVSPDTPVVKTIALADVTEALADSIPSSIENSDQLTLVLDDLVKVGKLSDTQAKQIKSALDNIGSVRDLTKDDADRVRGVK